MQNTFSSPQFITLTTPYIPLLLLTQRQQPNRPPRPQPLKTPPRAERFHSTPQHPHPTTPHPPHPQNTPSFTFYHLLPPPPSVSTFTLTQKPLKTPNLTHTPPRAERFQFYTPSTPPHPSPPSPPPSSSNRVPFRACNARSSRGLLRPSTPSLTC